MHAVDRKLHWLETVTKIEKQTKQAARGTEHDFKHYYYTKKLSIIEKLTKCSAAGGEPVWPSG